ncbi:4'-phosphopantetheinyl transferase [Streptomyces sp. NPDC058961]|uniref:4'-phosphopantetheinyl transferase family protein n=1 Tax=unclassified Streptomyces TaxID=2593676 RepID=UPI003667314E
MIERLVASGVCAVDTSEDVAEPGDLYPAEAALIANAVDVRRREFTTARWCARRALTELGERAAPILPGRHGAPGWPAGVLGSITHCAGFRAAAVARTSAVAALGIDAEPNAPVPDGVLDSIAVPGELRHVRELSRVAPRIHWDRLLFSAKEAVYKTWYPWTGQRLDFADAELSFALEREEGAGAFTAHIRPPRTSSALPPIRRLDGRWLAERGLLLCAITITASTGSTGSATSTGSTTSTGSAAPATSSGSAAPGAFQRCSPRS